MGKARAGGKKANGNGANLGFEEKAWAPGSAENLVRAGFSLEEEP